jgi:hypothetical protein
MAKRWDDYRVEQEAKHRYLLPCYTEDWGPQNFAYYRELKRPLSTILFQLRTHTLALSARMHDTGVAVRRILYLDPSMYEC